MRGHILDEAQMIMLFPLSLSGAAQRWFASLDPSRRRTWAYLGHRPLERDQISMIMRSLQPRFAKHFMGFPHTDFRSLVQALYGIKEGISRGLWADSSPSDSKGKKPESGPRPSDVSAIGMTRHRSPRHLLFQRQFSNTPY